MASKITPVSGHGFRLLELTPNTAPMPGEPPLSGSPTQDDFNAAFRASGVPPRVDVTAIEAAVRTILKAIGEDPTREGLRETPARVARYWREFIEYSPGRTDTAFESSSDGMVVVAGMEVFSLCEHHLLPFRCSVSVAYVPSGQVLGLSKLGRIAHYHAHRLQLQEQLVAQIAEHVAAAAKTSDVAVVAQGEHSCMTMRGIRTAAQMSSSVVRGVFKESAAARAEFFTLARMR